MPHEDSPPFLEGSVQDRFEDSFGGDQRKRFGVAGTRVETLLALSPIVAPSWPERRDHRQAEVVGRFEKFNSGAWLDLLEESRKVTQEAAQARRRRNRRTEDDLTRRVSRAEALVHMGEVSSARQALEGGARFRTHTERTWGPCHATSRAMDSIVEGSLESCRPHSVQPGSVDAPP